MSFDGKELSQQDSAPVTLFEFTRGATTWYYTNFAIPFSSGGHSYASDAAISMTPIQQSGIVPRDTLSIKLPISNTFAQTYLGYPPDQVTTVQVVRTHYDDSDRLVLWKGRITNTSASIGTLTLLCDSIFSRIKAYGLRHVEQRTCRYVFGGQGCNVNLSALAVSGSVLSISGPTLSFTFTLSTAFLGGMFQAPDGTQRMIIDISTPTITLMRPISSLTVGATCTVFPSCNHTTTACRDTYSNLGNFGGFPGIANINPMSTVSSIF